MNFNLQLIAFAIDDVEIVVGRLAQLLLDLALQLLLVTFNPIPIHGALHRTFLCTISYRGTNNATRVFLVPTLEVILKTLFTAAALLMISTASFAQTPAKTPSQSAAPVAAAGDWSASKLSGVNVYNEANDKVGEISDVIIESNGKVRGLVLEAGGFLGMGKHYVLVSMDSLKFANKADKTSAGQTSDTKREWYPDRAVMNVTKDQLKSMPEFKY